MPSFSLSHAYLMDKDGSKHELVPIGQSTLAPKQESEDQPIEVYSFEDAFQPVTWEFHLNDEQVEFFRKMFNHAHCKACIAPLRYRLQPKRSRIVRIGTQETKTGFIKRMLRGS